MKPRFALPSVPLLGMLILAAALPFAGCESFELEMRPIADTAEVYSLARTELIGEPSAFDFWSPEVRVLEQPTTRAVETQNFDLAFTEIDDRFVALPAGLFATIQTNPGVIVTDPGTDFDQVTQAPREDYITDEPVPLEEGRVYIVRTRSVNGTCTRYAKFEVLELRADGLIVFEFFRNDRCNDRLITLEE